MNASWPQAKTIWSICVKCRLAEYSGPACQPQYWTELAQDGRLSREEASAIISAFIDKDVKKFLESVQACDPQYVVNQAKFDAARRWKPRRQYRPPVERKTPVKKEEKGKFEVGSRVEYVGQTYRFLRGFQGRVVSVDGTQLGVEWDKAVPRQMGGGIRGHNCDGLTKEEHGYYCQMTEVRLLDPLDMEEQEQEDERMAEEEQGERLPKQEDIKLPGEGAEIEEDEFEKKLRELEEAHKRAKEEAKKHGRDLPQWAPVSIAYIKPAVFDDVCTMIAGGIQVCLVGPSGCGKSLLVDEVAKVLKRNFYVESFAGGKRYAQVFGSTQLEDGKSVWKPAKFLKELEIDNNIVFMDEVMSADADVLIGCNSILDRKSRCFHSPIGVVKVNETCTICAASNVTGREYSQNYKGTQQQDASVLNRFVMVQMDYDEKVEVAIMGNSKLAKTDQTAIYAKLKELRKAVNTNHISYDPSTRKLVQVIELMALGIPRDKAFEYSFLSPLSEVERRKISM